jgi:hypothetical protein
MKGKPGSVPKVVEIREERERGWFPPAVLQDGRKENHPWTNGT